MAKKASAIDEHWANWRKRHRAPRAIDLLMKNRNEEVKRAREARDRTEAEEPDFDVTEDE